MKICSASQNSQGAALYRMVSGHIECITLQVTRPNIILPLALPFLYNLYIYIILHINWKFIIFHDFQPKNSSLRWVAKISQVSTRSPAGNTMTPPKWRQDSWRRRPKSWKNILRRIGWQSNGNPYKNGHGMFYWFYVCIMLIYVDVRMMIYQCKHRGALDMFG